MHRVGHGLTRRRVSPPEAWACSRGYVSTTSLAADLGSSRGADSGAGNRSPGTRASFDRASDR